MTKLVYIILTACILSSCYGVNSKTSEIGDLNTRCLENDAWERMIEIYSTENITDSSLSKRVDDIENHFIRPKYILYFDSEPKEIIGSDFYEVRAVYSPKIADDVLDGLSPQLSDKEQVRIRNRVQSALMNYQCEEGKLESMEWMKRPAPFSSED